MLREYLDNIGLVDAGVAELVSLVEDFFGHDGQTTYVFTSDHGMTNWGKAGKMIRVEHLFKLMCDRLALFMFSFRRITWCGPSI